MNSKFPMIPFLRALLLILRLMNWASMYTFTLKTIYAEKPLLQLHPEHSSDRVSL